MRKIKLDLDAVAVESFETGRDGRDKRAGTVKAHWAGPVAIPTIATTTDASSHSDTMWGSVHPCRCC
jgi:hypothetical protein